MTGSLRRGWAIASFDIVSELRRPAALLAVGSFGAGALVALHIAVAGSGRPAPAVAAGGLWVVLLFGALLGTGRVLAVEREDGSWDRLLAAPVDRGALYAAKVVSAWVQALVLHAVLVPAYLVLFGAPDARGVALLVTAVVLADLGFAATGVLAGMFALRAAGRELLGAAMFIPLALPLVVVAVAISLAAWGDAPLASVPRLVTFLVAYNATFLVVGTIAVPELATE